MATTTVVRASTEQVKAGVARVVAYVGAGAFAISAVWFGLATHGVTMNAEPAGDPGLSVVENQQRYMAWFVTTLHQERLYTGIALAAFLCLAVTALLVRDALGRRALAKTAATAIVVGAMLWIVGNVAQLGAHRAVGLLATHAYTTETTSAVMFTADTVDDAFEVAAFAALGVGMLVLARADATSDRKGWRRCTAILGLAAVATAVSYLAQTDVTDLLLVGVGVVLLPVWLVWSGHLLNRGAASISRERP